MMLRFYGLNINDPILVTSPSRGLPKQPDGGLPFHSQKGE